MTLTPRDLSSAPTGIDTTVTSAARVYDYYLGGSHNFAADRELAEHVLHVAPWVRSATHHNRAFLRRVVSFLVAEAGIRQFLDLGSGIPTAGNVHEVAQSLAPESRVVYVDMDPVAVAHSKHLLSTNPRARVIREDIRNPASILGHRDTRALIDFSQPVGLLMVSVLLFIAEAERPEDLIHAYMEPAAPRSYLAISHGTDEHASGELRDQIDAVVASYALAGQPIVSRTRKQISSWLGGLEMVDPGIVFLPEWRPESDDAPEAEPVAEKLGYGVVARKPTSVVNTRMGVSK